MNLHNLQSIAELNLKSVIYRPDFTEFAGNSRKLVQITDHCRKIKVDLIFGAKLCIFDVHILTCSVVLLFSAGIAVATGAPMGRPGASAPRQNF